jgi:glutaconyl-CoA/methylmalonyl-CoA decarboxylase subunit gamma
MRKFLITVNATQYEVEVEEVRSSVKSPARQALKSAPKLKSAVSTSHIKENKSTSGGKKVTAPMPGSIIKVMVTPGDVVKKGQPLLVFEAMKMENDLTAPADGVVAEVNATVGATMAVGDVLVVIE